MTVLIAMTALDVMTQFLRLHRLPTIQILIDPEFDYDASERGNPTTTTTTALYHKVSVQVEWKGREEREKGKEGEDEGEKKEEGEVWE